MTERMSHLLIIDDDQRIRSLLNKFLCKAGFRVTSANGSYQARQLLKSLKFDLLICDVMMPGEDGLALIRHIIRTNHFVNRKRRYTRSYSRAESWC